MRSALRAGAKLVLAEAKSTVPEVSRSLANSLKIRTGARNGKVTALVYTRVFYARFVEFGTAAHHISAQKGWLSFGGIFAKDVMHKGAKPHPFMRPALDQTASAAVVAVGEQVKKRLTKEGIDTPDVLIEGDE